ncbi:MAG TPA: DUF4350 domain-containing protein [Alphaproteobacteria bacterium]|nr:DUF4350 domain-containing protein [Alphaproteobacteria bacterium]
MNAIFSPRLLAIWIAAALMTFALSVYFMLRPGDTGAEGDFRATSFSRSAIGYAGLAEMLNRLGIETVKSQYDSLSKVGPGGLLVLAEPPPMGPIDSRFAGLLEAKSVLVILPKWQGEQSKDDHRWIEAVHLASAADAEATIDFMVGQSKIVRTDTAPHWDKNELGPTPKLTEPVQVMKSDRLRPILASGDEMLIGEYKIGKRRIWIVSDPDAIDNHGLAVAGNPGFALALIDALTGHKGRVVFDETIHGYVATPPSPFTLLFKFPYVIVTALGAAALLLLLWGTTGRFGAPETTAPALAAGKQGLIENAARLIASTGHFRSVTQRYVRATIRDTARQLHAPRQFDDRGLVAWLERVGQARGVPTDLAEIARKAAMLSDALEPDRASLAELAQNIHRWKTEIMNGPSADRRARRGPSRRGAEGGGRAG